MKKGTLFILLMLTVMVTWSVNAVPPHPSLLEQSGAAKKAMPYFIANLDELHKKGICTGENQYEQIYNAAKNAVGTKASATGPFNVLAILVQFSDNASSSNPVLFDSLLFDSAGYTVRDYYDEISYGQLDIVTLNLPSSVGWNTAPQTYAYYVNNENGTGSYPTNCQKLVEDLVSMVDGSVDFSNYDNDNNNFVDVLVVIHAGQGAEVTGQNSDIWSHKWGISPKLTNDGVYVSSYTIQPEYIHAVNDMTIGVFAHELGHAFGLPDLYDTDYSSNGIGSWGIMSYGSWLGPGGNGGRPAHPCAWSRIEMGFASYTNVTSNMSSQAIADVKSSGTIYRLWTSGNIGNEYFLIENRQKTGYDSYLPASGLQIWHIDDAKNDNTQEWWPGLTSSSHQLVALEQADGLYELEHNNDNGDAADVFPGSLGKTDFDAVSSTTSDSYGSGVSFVAVQNIQDSGGNIIADLQVGLAAGVDDDITDPITPVTFELAQNYPNPFNPSTSIAFTTSVDGWVELTVYNIKGQKVRTLVNENISAGSHEVEWDGLDDKQNETSSGMYLYRLAYEDKSATKKMVMIR